MFEGLSERLDSVFRKLKGHGRLTEVNIEEGLKEVRLALLEADVHYRVVKQLVADIKQRAIGQEVLSSLTPGQQVIKIVNEELTRLMGAQHQGLNLAGTHPVSVMLVGLQGSGKTTTAGKLAVYLRKQGRRPYLVPADVYRPAAIDQLTKIAGQLGMPVFGSTTDMDPADICQQARVEAHRQGCDTVILDTAGRLHIDETLMAELGLSKMDGDARGGAALSIKTITGKPIKFVGVGEKLSDLEPFHPDRMASKILGMGDVLTLIEKAQETVDARQAKELERKLRKSQFTLEDFRNQLVQIRKMGSLSDLLGMIPGMGKLKQMKNMEVDETELVRIEAIICSMTAQERRNHLILNGSRRRRIAMGSGTTVQDVNRLLKNYTQMLKMIKQLNKGGMRGLGKGMLPT